MFDGDVHGRDARDLRRAVEEEKCLDYLQKNHAEKPLR